MQVSNGSYKQLMWTYSTVVLHYIHGRNGFYFLYFIHISFYLASARKAQPTLEKFWGNAKVEMRPPGMSDWPLIKKAFMNLKDATMSGRFLNVTIKEGVANTLVAVEIAMWFYVGEIIGRRSIVGYNV
jgi:F-type H+-transporting ATPase subunit g